MGRFVRSRANPLRCKAVHLFEQADGWWATRCLRGAFHTFSYDADSAHVGRGPRGNFLVRRYEWLSSPHELETERNDDHAWKVAKGDELWIAREIEELRT